VTRLRSVSCGWVAVRLAAAAVTGCQGGRGVWAHDFAPAFNTARGGVDGCVVVGVPNEATPATLKFCLGAAVTFVHPATPMARLRRVGRVDFDERHPGLLGLVVQEPAELGERPRMHRGRLGLAKPYPRPDPAQLLDGDTAPGAFSLGHDAFRNLMVDVSGELRLVPATLLEQPPRRRRFLGLQPRPQPRLSLAIAVHPRSGGTLTVAAGGDVDDAQIHPHEPVDRRGQRGLGRVDGERRGTISRRGSSAMMRGTTTPVVLIGDAGITSTWLHNVTPEVVPNVGASTQSLDTSFTNAALEVRPANWLPVACPQSRIHPQAPAVGALCGGIWRCPLRG
jgi:hypothetical protein